MWCIFQDCEGLSNIADNTHTLHRVLFLSLCSNSHSAKGQARSSKKSPECDVPFEGTTVVNIIFMWLCIYLFQLPFI